MKNNKVFIISIIIWAFITIIRLFNHIPWHDEAHAWTIAGELNIVQIFKLMKYEGHMLIWYLLLMPFAKLHLFYPWPMLFLNWLFCLLALIVFWKKAPFPSFLKVFITFSFPFLVGYAVYARCYSIGIFLLFLLTVFFKNKLNHPILYSVLLVACANTSVMALFGATAFGFLFLYDFFIQKCDLKKLVIPSILFILSAILLLAMFSGNDSTYYVGDVGINLDYFENTFIISHSIVNIILILIFGFLIVFFIRKMKSSLFILSFTYSCLIYTSLFIWKGHFWNHYFFFIYLIIAIWIALDEKCDLKARVTLISTLALISFVFIFNYAFANDKFINFIFNDKEILLAKLILNDKNLNGKTLILDNNGFLGFSLLPYSAKNGYNLINYCSDKEFNYSPKNYPAETSICYSEDIPNNMKEKIYVTKFSIFRLENLYKKQETAYLVGFGLTNKLSEYGNFFVIEGSMNKYILKKYKCFTGGCIWEITPKN